jgi:SAM-dependent methyltransferase
MWQAILIYGVLTLATLALISIVWTGPRGAPWLPTFRANVRRMLVMADLQPDEVLYDLGSGDGRVLFMAARDFGARAVGIEIDSLRCMWTRARIAALGVQDRVQVLHGDLFEQDVSPADVVVVYLLQPTNNKLMSKLWRELRPGTRVVSNTFIFPGWEPTHIDRERHLYLYTIRAKP